MSYMQIIMCESSYALPSAALPWQVKLNARSYSILNVFFHLLGLYVTRSSVQSDSKRCSTDKQLIWRVYDERCSHTKRLIEEIWKCLNVCLTRSSQTTSQHSAESVLCVYILDRLVLAPIKRGYGRFVMCSCVNLSSTIIPSTVT